jgi:hypothetical protein
MSAPMLIITQRIKSHKRTTPLVSLTQNRYIRHSLHVVKKVPHSPLASYEHKVTHSQSSDCQTEQKFKYVTNNRSVGKHGSTISTKEARRLHHTLSANENSKQHDKAPIVNVSLFSQSTDPNFTKANKVFQKESICVPTCQKTEGALPYQAQT